MIVKVKAKTINGSNIETGIDITIAALSFGSEQPELHNPVSTGVLAETLSELKTILHRLFPKAKLEKARLHIISKDLESISSMGIVLDCASLSKGLTAAIISHIARELGFNSAVNNDMKTYLKAHQEDFLRLFQESQHTEQVNPDLVRVHELLKDKKYQESFRLLSSIDNKLISEKDRREADFLSFSLRLKSGIGDLSQVDLEFRAALEKLGDRPEYVKKYYFEYIRFLENSRDFQRPSKLLKEFQEKYPLNLLDEPEKVTFYHLRGRAEYARGDYLRALKQLTTALTHTDPEDRENRAKLFNSSVNCFGDNLFFDEAMWIAEQASELRSLLNLPENMETLSCLAGLKTKQNKHDEALEILRKVEVQSSAFCLTQVEHNRLNNYLAKSLIFLGDYEQAGMYLKKAEAAGDPKGFSRQIRLLMYLKQKDFTGLEKLFNEVFILPENQNLNSGFDRFVLGWAYTIMAEASLIQQQYRDAVLYLNDAIAFFLSDKYVLEAKFATLLIWSYRLPEPYAASFRRLRDGMDLEKQFDEYVKKHSFIAESYFHYYDPKSNKDHEKSALAVMAARLDLMDDYNNNPVEVQGLLSEICLI